MRKVWSQGPRGALDLGVCPQAWGGAMRSAPWERLGSRFQPLPVPCAAGNFLVPPEKSINKIGHGEQAHWGKELGKLRPEEFRGVTQSPAVS